MKSFGHGRVSRGSLVSRVVFVSTGSGLGLSVTSGAFLGRVQVSLRGTYT